jgi:hypothetical protein
MSAPYFCWVKNSAEPRVPHKTLAEAYTEARRLLGLQPEGRRVYVLESIGMLEGDDSRTPHDSKAHPERAEE